RPRGHSIRRGPPTGWGSRDLVDTKAIGGPIDELKREEAGLLACVHCGFCLNACPTYTRLGHEGDSPRGRLDLMRAVMEGRLEPDDEAFRTHIDRCLGCRACEPVCPSGVPYGFLLERARSAIARSTGVAPSTRLLIAAYTGRLRGFSTAASRLLRSGGLARALARLAPRGLSTMRFGLAMLASSAPSRVLARGRSDHTGSYGRTKPLASTTDGPGGGAADDVPEAERAFADPHGLMGAYPAATAATPADVATPAGRDVGVLTGCVQQSLFARVNEATVRVLGVNVCRHVAVSDQVWCGARYARAGRRVA